MAATFTSRKDLKVERGFYRLIGVDSRVGQSWPVYLRSVLIFSVLGVLFVYPIQRIQAVLPYSLGLPAVPEGLAFNTAISFVTNTNWQSYSPEADHGLHRADRRSRGAELPVRRRRASRSRSPWSAGSPSHRSGTIGNFWVDVTRGILRILLPLSIVAAIVLLVGGVIQNFNGFEHVHDASPVRPRPSRADRSPPRRRSRSSARTVAASSTPTRRTRSRTRRRGRTCSRSSCCCSSRSRCPRTFGKMVGDNRQGYAILGAMSAIFVITLVSMTLFELQAAGTATQLAGAAMEGKEQRFGILGSTLFADRRRRSPRPAPSTRCTTASRRSAG